MARQATNSGCKLARLGKEGKTEEDGMTPGSEFGIVFMLPSGVESAN